LTDSSKTWDIFDELFFADLFAGVRVQ